jgi:hypothetical protein
MDDAEQQPIEKQLRARLAKPRYLGIFSLPSAYVVHVDGPFEVAGQGQERCPSVARAETAYEGRPGIVEGEKVRCEMPLGPKGPHSLAPKKRKFSKSYWEARQWSSEPPSPKVDTLTVGFRRNWEH